MLLRHRHLRVGAHGHLARHAVHPPQEGAEVVDQPQVCLRKQGSGRRHLHQHLLRHVLRWVLLARRGAQQRDGGLGKERAATDPATARGACAAQPARSSAGQPLREAATGTYARRSGSFLLNMPQIAAEQKHASEAYQETDTKQVPESASHQETDTAQMVGQRTTRDVHAGSSCEWRVPRRESRVKVGDGRLRWRVRGQG